MTMLLDMLHVKLIKRFLHFRTSYNGSCAVSTTGEFPNLFATAIQFFAASQCIISGGLLKNSDVPNNTKFDFIIVGSGSAGSVVANRLSERKDWSILLVEAGDDPPLEARIPALDKSMLGSKFDWQYRTTNDERINQANRNGSIIWPRGKMLGGSSNLNAMIYVHGNDHDYHSWWEAGNLEWSVEEVRRCFKKIESYQNMHLSENPSIYETYGHNGPLVINTYNSTYRSVTDKILSSWEEIGINNVPDLNTANVMGSGYTAATAANGERQSSNKAYLNPKVMQQRSNLKILKNSLVTKVLLTSSKLASGVQVQRGSETFTYYANKEVIVSAGTINSPQLLMLSGIGPKNHLAAKNINSVVDLPMVGQNLQDHCIIPIVICVNEESTETTSDQYFDVLKYLHERKGYLAQNSITDLLAFFSAAKNATFPDYQSHLLIVWKNTSTFSNIVHNQYRYRPILADHLANLNKNYTLFTFLFNLLHPNSRGNISLDTDNPNDHPLIYPNYFIDSSDLESAATGIKIITKILDTEYFKSIDGVLGRMKWPECDKYELDSREYWKCVCLNMVLTVYHPVGTCKMGTDQETSVVDSRLRVHGVKNLRVIDASVMPTLTSGNTNGPATMIGERGAELVKEDYLC